MAQKHLKLTNEDPNRKILFAACHRRISSMRMGGRSLPTYNETDFIASYIKNHGKDFCNKCAMKLIEQGKLVSAEFTITDSYKELIQKLSNAMQELHDKYITSTKNWAKKNHDLAVVKSARTKEEWYEIYKIETETIVSFGTKYIQPIRNRMYKLMVDDRNQTNALASQEFEKFEAKEIKDAERHFSESIEKLAMRITEKNLNTNQMTITHGYVRGNGIDTVITDGTNVVKANTIIAEGPINRPHYRYLVK